MSHPRSPLSSKHPLLRLSSGRAPPVRHACQPGRGAGWGTACMPWDRLCAAVRISDPWQTPPPTSHNLSATSSLTQGKTPCTQGAVMPLAPSLRVSFSSFLINSPVMWSPAQPAFSLIPSSMHQSSLLKPLLTQHLNKDFFSGSFNKL